GRSRCSVPLPYTTLFRSKAVAGGAELRLDMDARIGTGQVTGAEDFRVQTSTPFTLQRFRYYHGARLVNADRTAEYRLIDVRDRQDRKSTRLNSSHGSISY